MNTIIAFRRGAPLVIEALAAAALSPGHLLERTSADKLQKNSAAGLQCQRIVAVEDELQGNDIDTAYASGALVRAESFLPGDRAYVYLKAGENVAIGAKLSSAGDGTLKAATAYTAATFTAGTPDVYTAAVMPTEVIAIAREALDLSGGGAVATRLIVEFV